MSDTLPDPPSASAAVDPRPRQLLEHYASLVGALLLETADGLVEFEVPPGERRHWGRDRVVRVAIATEALDEDAEAALLSVGSPLFERLLAAVRSRGFRDARGLIPPTESPSPAAAQFPAVLEGATAGECRGELSLLPVGRLLARVSIKAGARLEERLIESPPLDLSTGRMLPQALAQSLGERLAAPGGPPPDGAVPVPSRPTDELLPLVFGQLESMLKADLDRIGAEASQALRAEVDRLERYYGTMLEEVEPGEDPEEAKQAKRAIRAELERRRGEEEDRHRIRMTVHPLQLIEWTVLAQRATWPLTTGTGRAANLTATRLLTGTTEWTLTCPSCGGTPGSVRVCQSGHASCPACSEACGVCGEIACRSHGLAQCASGNHPVCAEHARSCGCCHAVHCSRHSAHCAAADHDVCPECAVACARCGMALCRAHATRSPASSPRGERWLCSGCVVLCEGGTNEPVGLDEAVRCSSCERYICETHQVACRVDNAPHCSRHLRRSDRSGRLVCEHHRATCADEPTAILASDEVAPCATCGRQICEVHGEACEADGQRHCSSHLIPLADRSGKKGCEQHRTTCHVDRVAFSITGTKPCPVCDRATCESHRAACSHCARQVCVSDIAEGRCTTCGKLEILADPADDLIQAGLAANGGEPPKAKSWRAARDATSTVVELDLGWTRRLVFTVPHGETKPRTVVQHSLMGAKRLR